MKTVKKLLSVVLVLMLVLSFAGCHKKGEIAVEFGDVKFTSGMYSYMLVTSDMEARNLVDEALQAEGKSIDNVDYYSQTVEGVNFVKWVEDTAMEELAKIAAYQTLCKQNNLSLSADEIASIESQAKSTYDSYSQMFTENGIGYESFLEIQKYYAMADMYFYFLYDEDGTKAVPEEEIRTFYNDNYRAVFLLYSDLSQFTTDEEKTKEKERLNGFKTRLDAGESIVTIYNEFNNLEGDNKATAEKDVISLLSDPEKAVNSNYGFEDFAGVKAIETGKTGIIDQSTHDHEHSTQYYFVIKVIDATNFVVDTQTDSETGADKNYTFYDVVKDEILVNARSEEFETEISTFAATLAKKVYARAIKPFKVEKIKYTEY